MGKHRRDGTRGAREAPWGDAVDPDGDCQFELDPREDKVRIIVPGKTHILSAEIGHVNAPRLLRDIKGDFDLIVRVAGTSNPGGKATTTVYSPYHGAGLLIWQDEENYVRLEIATECSTGRLAPTSTSSIARTAPWPFQAASRTRTARTISGSSGAATRSMRPSDRTACTGPRSLRSPPSSTTA